MLRSYRELTAWQKAYALSIAVYRATRGFPAAERYGLSAQLRRTAVSIPSNIAEGYGRKTRGEYLQFLAIARGSVYELQTQLLLSTDLGFLAEPDAAALPALATDVERILQALISSLERGARRNSTAVE